MKRRDAPKTSIRNWLSTLNRNQAEAGQIMNRIKYINQKYNGRLALDQAVRRRATSKESIPYQVTHLFDATVLASIK